MSTYTLQQALLLQRRLLKYQAKGIPFTDEMEQELRNCTVIVNAWLDNIEAGLRKEST